jgi:hypothetical protein
VSVTIYYAHILNLFIELQKIRLIIWFFNCVTVLSLSMLIKHFNIHNGLERELELYLHLIELGGAFEIGKF